MSAVTAAPCLRDVLAEALWLAACWYSTPGFEVPAKAALYEELHDAAVTAPTDDAAWELIRAALAGGTAELGDLTAGELPGITSGGDAGTNDLMNRAAGVTA